MSQAKGESAKKRLVRRRLNMIDCMVNSFCGLLNSKERLEQVKDYHELSAAVSEIIQEKADVKQRREEDRKKEEADRAERKKQKEIETKRKEVERATRAGVYMKLIEDNGIDVINRKHFKVDYIQDILISVYDDPRVDAKGIKKDGLADFLRENHATNGTAARIARTAKTDSEEARDVENMGDVEVPYIVHNFSV